MSYICLVLLVIFAAFVSGGCAAYTKALYGEGPASEDVHEDGRVGTVTGATA
jgi:hypothetical protein